MACRTDVLQVCLVALLSPALEKQLQVCFIALDLLSVLVVSPNLEFLPLASDRASWRG